MALRLTYRAESTIPVELEGFTPEWACDKSPSEIEHFEIFHGNRKTPLAALFRITGDASDRQFDLEGNLSGVHWIGAHMTCGTIRIHGSAGRHVGSGMSGGEIHVDGDVREWLGAEMQNGIIRVQGNAGDLPGSAYRGSTRGMTGGTILITGDAGDEVGHTLRRGLVAVGGSAGEMVGFNMIAGTVLVFGNCGARPAAGMRRGTIGLFSTNPPALLPTFRYAATFRPQYLSVILRSLRSLGFAFDDSLLAAEFDLHHGDLVSLGRGEVLFRHLTA